MLMMFYFAGLPITSKFKTRRTWSGDERGCGGAETEEWGGDGSICGTGVEWSELTLSRLAMANVWSIWVYINGPGAVLQEYQRIEGKPAWHADGETGQPKRIVLDIETRVAMGLY